MKSNFLFLVPLVWALALLTFSGTTEAQTVREIYVTPFDPMVNCQYDAVKLGSELTGKNTKAGQAFFSGYDVELIKYIALLMKWSDKEWRLHCVRFNDAFTAVKNGNAFFATGGISITSKRMMDGYEFSLPVYTSGLKLAVRSKSLQDLWSFFLSFDTFLWMMILLTTVLTGVITWLFEDQTFTCKSSKRCRNNLKEMLWQAFASLFYTSEIRLQKFSARVVFLCFWFMVLVLTATYTADLTTKLATRTPSTEWKNIEEAAARARIVTFTEYKPLLEKYNIERLTSVERTPENIAVIGKMFLDQEVDGFIIDAPVADKFRSEYPCSTFLINEPVANFNYGYLYKEGTDKTLIRNIDLQLFTFKESTEMQVFAKKFIYVYPKEDYCVNIDQRLTMDQLAGLWIIMGGSIVLAVIIHIIDHCTKGKEKPSEDGVINKEEAEKERDQMILDSYLMINDYIHIPSKDLHLRIEEDIKKNVDNIEKLIKNRFNETEKKVLGYLNNQTKAGDSEADSMSQITIDEISDFLVRDIDEKVVYE